MTTTRQLILILLVATATGSCGDGPLAPAAGTPMQLRLRGVRALDPAAEGSYALWAKDAAGTLILHQPFVASASGPESESVVAFDYPGGAASFFVTVEPPGDADDQPSPSRMLGGDVSGPGTQLRIEGFVTDGRPLERDPGHHSLFTSSNNVELGYPSFENAGLWMFSISAIVNKHGTRYVKVTPLRPGWVYEGWIVRAPGTADEVWTPYGKFRPDELGYLTSRDNTGSEAFSGDADFRNGGVEDVPGGEWTTTRVADQLGVHMPGGLQLPLALDSLDAEGKPVWYHVITIEPIADEDEPMMTDRPFPLQPYRNAIGAGGPGEPRRIVYQGNDPSGEIILAP